MVVQIDGVASSADIRKQLKDEDRPVLLAFSRGKDSIAAWLALRDEGIPVVPYYMYSPPGLRFVEESLAYFEDFFSTRILRYPHPSLYRQLNSFVFQPPERCAVIDAAKLPEVTYEELLVWVREEMGLAPSTWVADGVRSADSIIRRISFVKHGAMKPSLKKVSVVWDWQIADVREAIAESGVELPIDYEWFGRSFDGIDWRFIEPLRREAPEDYARVLEWFPLMELEFTRREIAARIADEKEKGQ